jgi:hypothetical protein
MQKFTRLVMPVKSPLNSRRFRVTAAVLAISLILLALAAFQTPVQAQSDESLAAQYAPVLHFTAGEKFYPTSVDYIITSSILKQRNSAGDVAVVSASPSPENLGTFTQSDLFLDNKEGTLESIAANYASREASLGYQAYVRVVRSGASTVIQYWLFYIFNDGPLNQHQGDIEVVQVFLDGSGNGQTLLLSQHGAGENAAWADVEQVNSHPVVYVAQGSHANYFRAYQGKIGIENDIVGSDGKIINPEQLNLVFLGEAGNHPASQNWLDFPGRWGYVGRADEIALGSSGPEGPVFNQGGERWAQPQSYLAQTLSVNGLYFILAWILASFVLLFLIYTAARAAFKSYGIYKLKRKGGILVAKLLKGMGGIGFAVGIAAVAVTVAALFLPWYSITASSDFGPLAQEGGVQLMSMDGITGLQVNMFMGPLNSDSTSGFVSLFSAQMPFAMIFAAGIVLLVLDIIGMKSCKSYAKKLWIGVVGALLPIILILVFISQLPALLPFAAGLFPGQDLPPQAVDMVRTVAGSPIAGTAAQQFPVVGVTTVTWGLGIGAYLFVLAAILRIAGGAMMYTAKDLPPQGTPMPPTTGTNPQGSYPPPPPQSQTPQVIKRICPQCGHVVAEDVKFCPHCGKTLG